MRIEEGARVVAADGNELGRVRRVVVDPSSFEVTHVVVTGGLFDDDRVILASNLSQREDSGLVLDEAVGVQDLPMFEESRVVPVNRRDDDMPYSEALAWYWPYGVTGAYPAFGDVIPRPVEVERTIPTGESALRIGADVRSRDGVEVGTVEEIILGPDQEVDSFVVASGVFFPERTMVPIAWVAAVGDESVRLSVEADVLEGLPPHTEGRADGDAVRTS